MYKYVIVELRTTGAVRDEWYTPLPRPGSTRLTSTSTSTSTTSCTTPGVGEHSIDSTESSSEVLQDSKDGDLLRLTSRHYYSTTTALAITVGVGCILLVLNMLIFAGIYYQRDRDKKRALACSGGHSNGQETMIIGNDGSLIKDRSACKDLPPSYTTLPKSPSSIQVSLSVMYNIRFYMED